MGGLGAVGGCGASGLVSGGVASDSGLLPDKPKHKNVNFVCFFCHVIMNSFCDSIQFMNT